MELGNKKSSLLIRNAINNDFAQIAGLISNCLAEFNRHLSLESDDKDLMDIEATYMNACGIFLVAEDDSKIIGTVAVLQYAPGKGMLKKMYIDKQHRGKGLGKILLEEALRRCPALHIHTLYLETLNEMAAARALYTKYGFTTVKKVDGSVRCDLLMSLSLAETTAG